LKGKIEKKNQIHKRIQNKNKNQKNKNKNKNEDQTLKKNHGSNDEIEKRLKFDERA